MILVNLQFFANNDGKTEKATPKKRQDARKQGQVLQSREITTALVLVFMFIGLRVFGSGIYTELSGFIKKVLEEYVKNEDLFTFAGLNKLFVDALTVCLKAVAPLFAIALITGLIAEYAQVGFLFTFETLGFKFSRINPANGIKRVLSTRGFAEMLKALARLAVVGIVAYLYLKSESQNVFNIMDMDIMAIAAYIAVTSLNVAIRICIALILLGVLDYAYQWWEYEKSLRMSKQEIKEEYKQTEGNPEIKSKIKQKQKQISMRRMMQQVPKADVVITNPTHFAVALKYDLKVSDAPYVLAKGQDFVALRIKEAAKENRIEIVENKVLARTIYETVEIGEAIPPELYQAVAEILAFVFSLNGKSRAG